MRESARRSGVVGFFLELSSQVFKTFVGRSGKQSTKGLTTFSSTFLKGTYQHPFSFYSCLMTQQVACLYSSFAVSVKLSKMPAFSKRWKKFNWQKVSREHLSKGQINL